MTDIVDQGLIALHQVETTTTIKKTQIYDLMARGLFPKPIKLTPEGRRVAWLKSEVLQWVADRVKDSRSAT
ncbi:AlpA family phage regulatory protein [Chitinibacter sp. FCG-7]|uniref:AlpA family phage regulatory protein n=1 Tax=Chitinibacter mangrovi TaxID=3153927 RepID=A0AAU7FBX7_9NEIS